MRIAVPTIDGVFSEHFGRSNGVWLCEVENGQPQQMRQLPRPTARPVGGCESLPLWLRELGVNMVLAGGISDVAVQNLQRLGMEVSAGFRGTEPAQVAAAFLADPEHRGKSTCDCSEHHHHHCREH